jgi:hypothetical protein
VAFTICKRYLPPLAAFYLTPFPQGISIIAKIIIFAAQIPMK